MVTAEKARTGAHRWEFDWCPKCKQKTTFWFVAEARTKCAECATEKEKGLGLAARFDATEASGAPDRPSAS